MKKLGFLSVGLILFCGQILAQDIKVQNDPDEQIIVNKKYDENGNLIQYDSTYVHQWSSDSTFNFSFPDGQFFPGNNSFSEIDEFFRNFFGDSTLENFDSPNPFGNMPLISQKFFEQFLGGKPDSSLMWGFSHDPDSLIREHQFFPPGFTHRGFGDFEKQLDEMLENYPLNDIQVPPFRNEEQEREWRELMEKHQKEIEELRKKWDNN